MNTELPNSIRAYRNLSFEEFDSTLVGTVGRTILTGKAMAPWQQDVIRIDRATLQIVQEGAANAYVGEAPDGYISIVMGLPASSRMSCGGSKLDDGVMLIVRPGDPIISQSNDINRWCALTLLTEDFTRAVHQYDPGKAERLLNGPAILQISPKAWNKAVCLVNRVAAAVITGNFTSPQQMRVAKEELIDTFVSSVSRAFEDTNLKGRPKASRSHTIKHFRSLILDGPTVLTVTEMAKLMDQSERTLHTTVHKYFGMGPKTLLLRSQMHRVRIDLMHALPGTTVTRLLASHGIWEIGRFAQRYKRVYGEYPSKTLGMLA